MATITTLQTTLRFAELFSILGKGERFAISMAAEGKAPLGIAAKAVRKALNFLDAADDLLPDHNGSLRDAQAVLKKLLNGDADSHQGAGRKPAAKKPRVKAARANTVSVKRSKRR